MDPTIVGLVVVTWLFAPKPKLFTPKPDMKEVAAAQAEADRAKADLNKAEAAREKTEAELEALRVSLANTAKQERDKERSVLGYTQEMTEMAADSLSLVPQEFRTPEVVFAAECLAKVGGSLTAVLGPMTPSQRADTLKIVQLALSKAEADRKEAQRLLAEKDRQLATNVTDMALLRKEVEVKASTVEEKKAELGTVKAEVQVAKAESTAKDVELRNTNEKNLLLAMEHRSSLWFYAGILVFLWLWFTRILPALAHTFPWAAFLNNFNKFALRCIVGGSNMKD